MLGSIARTARADETEKDRFLADQRGAMTVLGGWSLGSMAAGVPMSTSDSARIRYAGIQNVAWGAIDGGLALVGIVGAYRASTAVRPDAYWQAERASLKRIFLINVGLDVLYIAAGTSLALFAKTDELRGTGAGNLTQGTFLLGLDGAAAFVMRAVR